MKRLFCFTILLLCLSALGLQAARLDTLNVYSPSMNKEVKVLYILPEQALMERTAVFPVVYLLHGYSGNALTWLHIKPELPDIADAKGIIFVCPDGKNSWYWDSPKNPDYKYETFVSNELVAYTDMHYPTVASKQGRAITGLSMGGHGALWNAIRHKEVFGAAGSTSGGVDIRPFPANWEMKKLLGEFASNKEVWNKHTVVNLLDRLSDGDLALIVDCGDEDFFLEVNRELHRRLLSRGIKHDFIIRPGRHDGAYWNNSIDYQILFFEKFFKRSMPLP